MARFVAGIRVRAQEELVKVVDVCLFDNLLCKFVGSCDDVLALLFGLVPPYQCPRAVVRLRKKGRR